MWKRRIYQLAVREKCRRSKLLGARKEDIHWCHIFYSQHTICHVINFIKKNKIKKNRKRATQIVDLHISASAEIESSAMKGRSIYGGEELKFDTNRMIEARESNSSTLKEIVIDPAIQTARNMKVTELRDILVVAYPHEKKDFEDEEDHWPFRST